MLKSKGSNRKEQSWRQLLNKVWGLFRFDEPQVGAVKAPDIMESLENARREWQYAEAYFNSVQDPDLIDHAIFYMGATEKKYTYLLKQAKEKGINIERFSLDRVG
ncbi:MAG: DUF2508 family protein [Bacteroidota bacterium]